MSIREVESTIHDLPKQKAPGPMGSLVNSTKHLKKKLY